MRARWKAKVLLACLVLPLPSLGGCMSPCQRHSDCPAAWQCRATGVCEPEPAATVDPIDAGDDRVHELADGALDDSDLADPADADLLPDAI